MANLLKLTVDKSTPSSNGGFILKLANKNSVDTGFGTKETQITYYMKVATLGTGVAPGFTSTLDLDKFDTVIRDYVPTEGDNAGVSIPCKWLKLKPAA